VKTGLSADVSTNLVKTHHSPEGLPHYPKVKSSSSGREVGSGAKPFDYGMAELVAFASVLENWTLVHLTGRQTQRGTFNQRHAIMVDTRNRSSHSPLSHLAEKRPVI
jgi:2-oxoglutarate dehydrogenase E1 component